MVLDMIRTGYFSPQERSLFAPIVADILERGDYYMLLADYRTYIQAQENASKMFTDTEQWALRSILNTARLGRFSSDRAVLEYATNIWNIKPMA